MAQKQRQQLVKSDLEFRLNPLSACVKAALTGNMLLAFALPVAAELPVPSPVWNSMGNATLGVAGNTMNINQIDDRVILNWEKFNISADSAVNFHQKTTDIALNKIHDQNPSQILGRLTADGQIYLVNPNGILFGRNSSVNARGLVAATMDVGFEDTFDKELINTVYLKDDRAAFVGSGEYYQKDGNNYKLDAAGNKIPIQIEIADGARLSSSEGGRIMILAPSILNRGTVESPGGQVIMAAATDKVYLQQAPYGDSTKQNNDVRGLLVEVKTGGKVENLGTISAERGNVTLMGFAVNQDGRVSATTASNVNGSIRLLAREGASVVTLPGDNKVIQPATTTRASDAGDGLGTSAKVSFGPGSVTEILPDLNAAMAIDKEAQPASRIEVMGHKIHMQSGSTIVAPAGDVKFTATKVPVNPVADNRQNDSRILIESGASIDVSGTDYVVKSMESNVIEVQLRNFQLADAPLQKNGVLKGETIKVDIREGTPLTNIQPSIDQIKKSVAERLSKGGNIELNSEGDVILEQGSVIDFSGGAITFLDGMIETTILISNGRLINIRDANPLFTYDGIFGRVEKLYKKWNITASWLVDGPFSLGRFEAGYVEGQDAGSLFIKANTVILDGDLRGGVISGRLQRNLLERARAGRLLVNSGFTFSNAQSIIFSANLHEPLNVDIDELLATGQNDVPVALALNADKLYQSGVGEATFISNGQITIADNARVQLIDGGTLTLKGGAIDVLGDIVGSGAKVNLSTVVSDTETLDGDIRLANGADILLQGQWVNDYAQPDNLLGKSLAINGGSFTAKVGGSAGGNLTLEAGSRINVSGGAWLQTNQQLVAGTGGSISLTAEPDENDVGANVTLDGLLEGYGLEQGGHFTVMTNAVAIRREDLPDANSGVKPLQITTDFFSKGGFAEFDIGANMNGLTVESGAQINLSQTNLVLTENYLAHENADSIQGFSTQTTLQPLLRQASSLTLRSNHAAGANPDSLLRVEQGAGIVADNSSTIKLESDSSVVFDGRIEAHGGNLLLSLIPDESPQDPNYVAEQGIWLGRHAQIDLSGASDIEVDSLGRRTGLIYGGGNFVVDAQRGFFAAQAGSMINVSGTQAVVDVPAAGLMAEGFSNTATLQGSNAGRIDITSAEGVFLDGGLLAQAGQAPGTTGGTLSLFLNVDKRRDPDLETGSSYPGAPRVIKLVQQATPSLSGTFQNPGDSLPTVLEGLAKVAVDQIRDGGFGSLNLAASGADGEIRFSGPVDMRLANGIALDAPRLGWEGASGPVNLSATTASIGSDRYRTPSVVSNINKIAQNPIAGSGSLTVSADLIDLIGGTVTRGYDAVNLNSSGDIRMKGIRIDSQELDFVGEFKTYSKLVLTADQIYPTTLTNFTLGVQGDPNGSITINPGGEGAPVLSALGSLTVAAPNIIQNGTLLAPLGQIYLQADNLVSFGASSLTSVSASGLTIPLGITQGGQEWLLPLAGTGNNLNVVDPSIGKANLDKKIILSSPEKKIVVSGQSIAKAEGAEVNLSGGGDLLAFEFIPGDGGSKDVLDSTEVFAILPSISGYAPFDPKSFPDSGLKTGDSIYISAGSGLEAGYYTLLPARYALLDGAYLVTPLANSHTGLRVDAGNSELRLNSGNTQPDYASLTRPLRYAYLDGADLRKPSATDNLILPDSSRLRVDGAPIVSGYRAVAGTDIRDQNWSEFVIEPGSIAKTRSEYNLSLASTFFKTQAEYKELAVPRLVQDAGQLVLSAQTALELPNVVANAGSGGKGGLVDIIANNLAVVSQKTGTAGRVEILSSDIDNISVDSISIGAERSFDAQTGVVNLDVKAQSVTIAENTLLEAPEILLSATDTVRVAAGAHLKTKSTSTENTTLSTLAVDGDGALLRLSFGQQAQLNRTGVLGNKGDLLIENNTLISAGTGALLLDSTLHTRMDGELQLAGGSLSIGADVINLGETAGINSGVSLDNSQLSRLSVAELVLNSRGMVNLYGQLQQVSTQQPLQFGNLTINAAGLAGKQNAGKTARLQADRFSFQNSQQATASAGDGTGSLLIDAGQINLGSGDYQLSGFGAAQLNASQGVFTNGTGTLTSAADLSVTTPFMSGMNGAKTTIDASGHQLVVTGGAGATQEGQGVAAQLDMVAASMVLNSSLLYQAGNVGLSALQSDLSLGAQALIDVSGKAVFAGLSAPVNLPAGKIKLLAAQGNINAADAQLLLNGVQAGTLTLSAAQGQVSLGNKISAQGSSKALGGSVLIDTQTIGGGGFGAFNSIFANAGFTGGIDFRLRNGDMTVESGQTVTATRINLAADNGALTIAGTLDARGDKGGQVDLASKNLLSLSGSILANAQAAGGKGGKVSLSSVDAVDDGADILFSGNAFISVAGSTEGEVHLRADRTVNDVAVAITAADPVTDASKITAEAVKIYTENSIGFAEQSEFHDDNTAFMNGLVNTYNLTIVPGVEVRSTGDLTIAEQWDLVTWRYGADNLPGVLTLRAAGDIKVQQTMSDGFVNPDNDYANASTPIYGLPVYDYLQTNDSWSYQLVAGADLAAANTQAVLSNVGDVELSSGIRIRTGTGDISLLVGRDILYGDNNALIYTAGRADANNDTRWGSGGEFFGIFFYAEYPLDGGDIQLSAGRNINAQPTTQLVSDWLVRTGSWTTNTDHSGERPTAWGVALGMVPDANPGFAPQHQQSVAAFGGGNVSIRAGNDINDLSVVIPTTGKQIGEKSDPNNIEDLAFNTNKVQVFGGGDLQVDAGGDIAGGVFYVDNVGGVGTDNNDYRGSAEITAFGSLIAGHNLNTAGQGLSPILVSGGNTQFNVFASKSLSLAAIVDPFFVTHPQGAVADIEGNTNRFFRYGPNGAVNLQAVTGNITLVNHLPSLNQATNADVPENRFSVLPASLTAYALNGNLAIDGGMALFPSATGELELYANTKISGNAFVHLPDTEPAFLPSALFPIDLAADETLAYDYLDPFLVDERGVHALSPLHAADSKPVLISTQSGNIGGSENLSFTLAKPAEIMAGRDLFNTSVYIQNNRQNDVSVIRAGRDIRFPVTLNPLNGQINLGDQVIEIAGPGDLVALAGRNVDMGAANGMLSIGAKNNPALAEHGANISVYAGIAEGQPDAMGFANRYMKDSTQFAGEYQQYRQRLINEVSLISGQTVTDQNADAVFATLSAMNKTRVEAKLLSPVQSVYMKTITKAADASAAAKAGEGYKQTWAELEILYAVETLFPGSTLLGESAQTLVVDPVRGVGIRSQGSSIFADTTQREEQQRAGNLLESIYEPYQDFARATIDVTPIIFRPSQGDVLLFLSTLQTQKGGEVSVFTPNGGINVGLATADIGLDKTPDQQGIIVNQTDAINIVARDDIAVNVQRVVAIGGGAIKAGSTEHDVDAGRSPLTALAAPPFDIKWDVAGMPEPDVKPLLAGGGIRTIKGPNGEKEGNVVLFAPRGVINAGEAGIAGDHITLASPVVQNSNFIQANSTTGAPAPAANVAPPAGVSNLAATANKSVNDAGGFGGNEDKSKGFAKAALGMLSVEVLGFGDSNSGLQNLINASR